MVALPELPPALPARIAEPGPAPVVEAERRVVAVAPDAVELLRPGSDLLRRLADFAYADVLLAAEVVPALDDEDDADEDDDADDTADEVLARAAALEHPDLLVHRLGLRAPLGPGAEDDLVAALSELVGFDPEPGVYCLAPAGATTDPVRATVSAAARRIARVYGLPLLRYRCLELSIVPAAD